MDTAIDQKVEDLLSKMSLEEKVGQMTQIALDVVTKGEDQYSSSQPYELDIKLVKEAIHTYKVGSIFNTPTAPLSREEWYKLIKTLQDEAAKTPLQIPIIYGIDAIHGVNYTTGGTLFPQQLGLAATFNTKLVEELASIAAYETRASSIPWNFSPVLDLGKNSLWPRLWETFGEDAYLSTSLGEAMIKGYQGTSGDPEKVMSCMKHYIGYGSPLSGKDRTPAWIPERELRQYFLPVFKKAIDAGSATLMISSGEINGTPVHCSKFLLTEVLREELGFEGIAVTDWADINYLHTRHKVAPTIKDAVRMAINAGVDMSMVPHDFDFIKHLLELVNEGLVSQERVDSAVRRILKVKLQLNLFQKPVTHPDTYPKFGCEAFKMLSQEAAEESITLLKNKENLLPLSEDCKVLITGPSANSMRPLNGGWSYSWQGDEVDTYTKDKNTVADAFATKKNVVFKESLTFENTADFKTIEKEVEASDVVLLCLGENSYTETPGNTHSLIIPDDQVALIEQIATKGKKIILVLFEGRPLIFSKIEPLVDAVFMAYLPGNYGADALLNLVYGNKVPSGRLPINYPKHPHSLVNYNHKHSENIHVPMYYTSDYDQQYEFGHGLSYTTFTYSDLQLSALKITENEVLNVSVTITNTGLYTAKESVLLFISDLYASITPEVKALKGFKKIELAPNTSKKVTFNITKTELSFVNEALQTIVEPGDFEVHIGPLTQRFEVI
ncbi:glycoside hydrolase family 3 C-terminal domain-containing protein [Aquimarina sp. ERC-38]|uniref:glycoside hydrolase family 3 N-terminal domain-containing protein n=1 Tax=Aquimarina sp. ERC-38 TaxID=2949996 RepID=UPI002246D7B6|nr:glycoside hydrolase family 3 N-terminal domain-containing protein [Aquimarina sp. ERC-38]UZO81491.1 glycoside hydrolase family 3 C-terminal domain-containing protein [Aquimarina sp. ERC-38]